MHFWSAMLALFLLSPAADPTVPAGAPVLYTTQGRGVQIYRCDAGAGAPAWIFEGPEATLFREGATEPVGTHGAGPTWTWKDGSSVRGKVIQKRASPDSGSIPWLLLAAEPAAGTAGALSPVVWVRRSETHGGNAPTGGCDAAHAGTVARVEYTAAYTFYGSGETRQAPR